MVDESKIKVVIAEDHRVTRLGIRFCLEEFDGVEVIGEAKDGKEAVDMAASLKPDVILMDIEMPEIDGIQAARLIRKNSVDVKIVMLTTFNTESEIFAALAAGANGYCLKDVSDNRLHTAIKSVSNGDTWLDSNVVGKIVGALPTFASTEQDEASETLSNREKDVLKLIVDGLSNGEIAKKLFISNDTVKTHLRHILEKLKVSDRTQAAVKAVKNNLL